MLLRRITEHVKAQNWTAVALDFVIVVMGVFIGVQVNGWWAGQADAQRERVYLAALAEDFDDVITEFEDDLQDYANIATAMSFLLEQSRMAKPDASADALNEAARLLIQMEGTPIVSTTYDNLTGSGDLSIIQNQEIKTALSAFYSQASVIDLVGQTHELQLVNLFQPYIIANLDYPGMLNATRSIKPVAAFDPDLVYAAVSTQEFRNLAAVKWDIATDLHDQLETSLANAKAVRQLLANELETAP